MLKYLVLLCVLSTCSKHEEPDPGGNPLPPSPPSPPSVPVPTPPPEEVEVKTSCSAEWYIEGEPSGRSYLLTYNVTKTKSKDVHVSFKSVYQTTYGTLNQDAFTALYKAGSAQAAVALVPTVQWSLTLQDKKATFKRVHTNETREVSCD